MNIPFMWLGISFGIHAFPSDGDAKSLWAHSKRMWRENPVALIGFPLVIVIVLVNILRFFWFDFILRDSPLLRHVRASSAQP